jgi:hypothetical protein
MPRKTKKEEVTAVQTETVAAPETPVTEVPSLTLADVKNAVNVIDHAAEQGAFKGWNVIAQVMQVRNRLATFVETAAPKTEAAPVDTATDEAANS